MSNKAPYIICYVPAIHQGYLSFFNKYSDSIIYVIDNSILTKIAPRLERDIRAISASQAVSGLQAIMPLRTINLLEKKDIESIKDSAFVAPDEDVTHEFAKKYLEGSKVEFVSTFLRWDKIISTTEYEVKANRTISSNEYDKLMIEDADDEASKSPDWWRQVGAVVVKERQVILKAHNKPYPTENYTLEIFGDPRSNFNAGQNIENSKAIHAEASLIASAANRGISLKGCDLYVTTFPCPVCAKLVATAGFNRVFYKKGYSLLDAEDIFNAKNIEIILVK